MFWVSVPFFAFPWDTLFGMCCELELEWVGYRTATEEGNEQLLVMITTYHAGFSEPWTLCMWTHGFNLSLIFGFTWCVFWNSVSKLEVGANPFFMPIGSTGSLSARNFRFLFCSRQNNPVPGWDVLEGGKNRSWKVEYVFLSGLETEIFKEANVLGNKSLLS